MLADKKAWLFIRFYCSERIAFVCSLASLARQESFGRPGLMAFASCLSSAALGTEGQHLSEVGEYENLLPEMEKELDHGGLISRSSELLDILGVIAERSKQHFNPNYRLQGSLTDTTFFLLLSLWWIFWWILVFQWLQFVRGSWKLHQLCCALRTCHSKWYCISFQHCHENLPTLVVRLKKYSALCDLPFVAPLFNLSHSLVYFLCLSSSVFPLEHVQLKRSRTGISFKVII